MTSWPTKNISSRRVSRGPSINKANWYVLLQQKPKGGVPSTPLCTTVGVWVCVQVPVIPALIPIHVPAGNTQNNKVATPKWQNKTKQNRTLYHYFKDFPIINICAFPFRGESSWQVWPYQKCEFLCTKVSKFSSVKLCINKHHCY